MLLPPELKTYEIFFLTGNSHLIKAFYYKVYEGMVHFYSFMDMDGNAVNPEMSVRSEAVSAVYQVDENGNNVLEVNTYD